MPQPLRIKYTPAQIAIMSDATVKARYQRLRKVATARVSRLEKAGYGKTDVADVRFPSSRELTPDQMRAELAEASRFLRDPRTTVKGMRTYVKRAEESLKEAGYQEAAKDLKKFGDFMENMRARHKGRLMPSDVMATIYDEASRVGVSGKTLERNFKEYLDQEEKAQQLLKTLQETELPKSRKRLSSKELKALL